MHAKKHHHAQYSVHHAFPVFRSVKSVQTLHLKNHFMNAINSSFTQQQAHAYRLYTSGQFTQKEIADTVGVTVRTVYTWIRTFSWQQLKDTAAATPALIAEKLS